MDEREIAVCVGRAEAALDGIEALPDGPTRTAAVEAVQALVALYGEGLARILAMAAGSAGANGGALPVALANDPLVAHLLIVHDLHPCSLDSRVEQALAEVRPYLQSHGGDVELLGIEGGVARVRLQGSCKGCPASAETMRGAVEQAVRRAAPELEGVEAVAVESAPAAPRAGFIPLAAVR